MNSNEYKLEVVLTQKQYQLAIDYQNSYELLFNKKLPLEDLFKISLFFSLNINNQKIATLNTYEDKTKIINKTTHKAQQKTFTKFNKKTKNEKTTKEVAI